MTKDTAGRSISSGRARTVETDEMRLRILELGVKHLTDAPPSTKGHVVTIAEIVDLPRSEVQSVLGFAGWPSLRDVTRARDNLRQRLEPAKPAGVPGFAGVRISPPVDEPPRRRLETVELDDLVDAHARQTGTGTAYVPTGPSNRSPMPSVSFEPTSLRPGAPAEVVGSTPYPLASEREAAERAAKVSTGPGSTPRPMAPASAATPTSFRAAMVRSSSVMAHPSNIGRDLGDLRDLARSIKEHGLRVPLALEVSGVGYRIRDGHRRLAAAQMAGVKTLPALIHAKALEEKDWLLESIDYNTRRQGYTPDDVRRVAGQLEALGVDRRGIAQAFNVSANKLREILAGPKTPAPAGGKRPVHVVSKAKVREAITKYRARLEPDDVAKLTRDAVVVDVATFLDELEGLLS